jgi:hypothetical protein
LEKYFTFKKIGVEEKFLLKLEDSISLISIKSKCLEN